MLINLFERRSLNEKLECVIRKEYSNNRKSVTRIAKNIQACYESDMAESKASYFSVQNNRFEDLMSYVRFCGGYKHFDYSM